MAYLAKCQVLLNYNLHIGSIYLHSMNFLNIDTASAQAISDDLERIAKQLFNNYLLRVNDSYYRLIDIEFYLHSKGHEDTYTHGHDLQKQTGRWYFHRSGIDITFGNGDHYGGILIRSMAKLPTNGYRYAKLIYGPINVKTEISSNFYGVFESGNNIFSLVPNNASDKDGQHFIIPAQRINLNEKKNVDFVNKPYRYVLFIGGHTFEHKNKEAIVKAYLEKETMGDRDKAIKMSVAILNYNAIK